MPKAGEPATSPGFLQQVGKLGEGVTPSPKGMTSSRVETGRAIIAGIIHDAEYLEKVKIRVREGLAPQLEVYFWKYLHGDPPKDMSAQDEERAKYEKIRAELHEYMQNHKEEARVLSAVVTRAPRLLPPPRLFTEIADAAKEPKEEPPDGAA